MESGTAEQLANNPEVRRKYLGQNFELRKAVLGNKDGEVVEVTGDGSVKSASVPSIK